MTFFVQVFVTIAMAGTYLSTIPKDHTWAWAFILWMISNSALCYWAYTTANESWLAGMYAAYVCFALLGVYRLFRKHGVVG